MSPNKVCIYSEVSNHLGGDADPQSEKLESFSMSKMKPLTLQWLLDSRQHVKSFNEGCDVAMRRHDGDNQSSTRLQVQDTVYHANGKIAWMMTLT